MGPEYPTKSRGSTALRAGRPGSRASESAPYGIEAAARLPSADQPTHRGRHQTARVVSRPVRVLLVIVKLESPVRRAEPHRRDRHVRKPPQPVRAHREQHRRALMPTGPRRRVVHQECPVTLQRLDARPFASSGYPRSQVAPGSKLVGRPHHGCCSTARRPYTRCPVRFRSAPIAATAAATRCRSSSSTSASGPSSSGTVSRSSTASGMTPSRRKKCRGRCARKHRPVSSAWSPFTPGQWSTPVHQAVLHRVDRCVHQLVHHVLAAHKLHDAYLLRRPQVLPPPSQCILTPREQLVKMLEERRIPAPPIEDHGMIMIAERARQHHLDLAPLRSLDQAVRERVVRLGVGPQQELALRAATGDQVELTGEHLPRQRHPCRRIKKSANPPPRDLTRLAPRTSERRPRVSELSEIRAITGQARLPSQPALLRPLQTNLGQGSARTASQKSATGNSRR